MANYTPKEDKLVVEHNGEQYLLDANTRQLTPLHSEESPLKLPNGLYKPSVKALAKRKYFEGYTLPDIEREVGVKLPTLQKWAYGRKEDCSSPKCWKSERDRYFLELEDKNQAAVHHIDSQLLLKLQTFFNNAESPKTPEDARIWAEIREKLQRSSVAKQRTTGHPGASQGPLQVNINQSFSPMSMEEAKKVLEADVAFEAEFEDAEEPNEQG